MPNYAGKYNGLSYRERADSKSSDYLKRTFHKSTSYYECDVLDGYESIINNFPLQVYQDTNSNKKSYKNFVTHPDYDLDYGYIVECNGDTLIVMEINNHNTVNQNGSLAICDNELKWKDGNDVIHTTPAYIDWNRIKQSDNKDILLQDGYLEAHIQLNEDTKNIFVNQRFILGSNVFKTTGINDGLAGKKAIVNMEIAEKATEDDFENGIAYNLDNRDIDSSQDSTSGTEYIFSDNEAIVNEGLTKNITVYEYDGDTQLSTTFTWRIDGVDSSYYDLVGSANSVDITGLKSNSDGSPETGTLVAINADTLEEASIPIEFKGLW